MLHAFGVTPLLSHIFSIRLGDVEHGAGFALKPDLLFRHRRRRLKRCDQMVRDSSSQCAIRAVAWSQSTRFQSRMSSPCNCASAKAIIQPFSKNTNMPMGPLTATTTCGPVSPMLLDDAAVFVLVIVGLLLAWVWLALDGPSCRHHRSGCHRQLVVRSHQGHRLCSARYDSRPAYGSQSTSDLGERCRQARRLASLAVRTGTPRYHYLRLNAAVPGRTVLSYATRAV
jgi:hypothetical protein